MPFPPELQARIDAIQSGAFSAPVGDELAQLKAKLARRIGRPGYTDNAQELEQHIAEIEGETT